MNRLFRTVGLAVAIGLAPQAASTAAAADVHPIDRVPANAALFAHLRAGAVWNHPVLDSIRKQGPKELDTTPLNSIEKDTGVPIGDLETVTFHFPKLPTDDIELMQFVLQVTTKRPYDRNTVLAGLRDKDAKVANDTAALKPKKLVVHFTTPTQFTVTHESLLATVTAGASKVQGGPLAPMLQAAKTGKADLSVAFDPAGLPAEVFNDAPAEVRPFVPLLKSKVIGFQATLGKDLTARVRFVGADADAAVESERSLQLLVRLADEGLASLLKDEQFAKDEDYKSISPALTEIHKGVQKIKAERTGNDVSASFSVAADGRMVKPFTDLVLKPRAAAARVKSQNNLKQIALALHAYHDSYGSLPPAAIVDKKGKPLLSWRVAILPFIEQDNLYKRFKLDEPWDSKHNLELVASMPATYAMPYDGADRKHTIYRAFSGNGAILDPIQGIKFNQVTDGLSNTVIVAEAAEGVVWTKPDELDFDPKQPILKKLRFEKGSCQAAFGDGSVRAISNKVTEEVWKLLIQRNDGKPIPELK